MPVVVREYREKDIPQMVEIWNGIVQEGKAFPEEDPLTIEEAKVFFHKQSFTAVAEKKGKVVGLYILHPNNIGRCSHIANASYGVKRTEVNQGIGKQLVLHSLKTAKQLRFRIMQFNAVVTTNEAAIHLYEKLGFISLGIIPKGFRQNNGYYSDIMLFYKSLD